MPRFPTKAGFVAGLLGLLALAGALWLRPRAPRVAGPLPHDVYVWQRVWNEPVVDAVREHGTNFAEVAVLAAEVAWQNGQPTVARVVPDYTALRQAGVRLGLVLRIGPFTGPFAENDVTAQFLSNLAGSVLDAARTNAVAPAELQIDFDCAEARLDGYAVWLGAIQKRVAPVPVTITALPSWLDRAAFRRLAAHATNYVLQVHSLARPRGVNAPFALCDPPVARRAVERAGRIGIPFRVALPTYGYELAFDPAGKLIGLAADGPARTWPSGAQVREVRADPVAMADLVRGWRADRPAALRGVIWYRLPVVVDNLNWRWPTLAAIVASRSFRDHVRAESRRVEAGLVEISLINDGDLDISSRLAVEVHWSRADGGRLIAGDAVQGFSLLDEEPSQIRFQQDLPVTPLRAGETRTIGWLRLAHDGEVQLELQRN
ncbi:MAG TPA: DUF3142 domain-containing protein [Verrucomicrobiae bacterium]|nr:DUF3142 domain-containing protein [Verrucomicrobiae bacterium]